jgi:hypothetical protein
MKATLMGVEVNATLFLAATIVIVVAQLSVWRFARQTGLIEANTKVAWTRSRILACIVMVALSVLALICALFAFLTSFVAQWQALWLIAATLAIAGIMGLAMVPRLLFK